MSKYRYSIASLGSPLSSLEFSSPRYLVACAVVTGSMQRAAATIITIIDLVVAVVCFLCARLLFNAGGVRDSFACNVDPAWLEANL